MIAALAWPIVAVLALCVFVWVIVFLARGVAAHRLATSAENGLKQSHSVLESRVEQLRLASIDLGKFGADSAKDIARLKIEVEKLALSKAFGRTA